MHVLLTGPHTRQQSLHVLEEAAWFIAVRDQALDDVAENGASFPTCDGLLWLVCVTRLLFRILS
jgi:hypothetical protein